MDNDMMITAECVAVVPSQQSLSSSLTTSRERRRSSATEDTTTDNGLRDSCAKFRAGVKVKDHRYRAKTYKACFVGSEAVDFMVMSRMASSREEAVELGRRMSQEYNLFEHVSREHAFEDGQYFYRFLQGHRPPPADRTNHRAAAHGQRDGGAANLSYTEMCLDVDGSVLTREQIKNKRIKLGFCPECPGEPVRLFDIQRSKINPLSRSRDPLSVEGESLNGQCLLCHPELGPKKKKKKRKKKTPSGNVPRDGDDFDMSMDLNESTSGLMSSASGFGSSSHIGSSSYLESFLENGGHRGPKGGNRSTSGIERDSRSMPTEVFRSERSETRANGVRDSSHSVSTETDSERFSREPSGSSRRQFRTMGRYGESDSSDTMTSRDMFGTIQSASLAHLDIRRTDHRPPDRRSSHSDSLSGSNGLRSSSMPLETENRKDAVESSLEVSSERAGGDSFAAIVEAAVVTTNQSASTGRAEESVEDTVSELESLVGGLVTSGDSEVLVDVLVNAMKTHPDAVQVQVCCLGAFFDMCKNRNDYKDANIARIMASSAPDDILRTMGNLLVSARVQEEACRVLWSLSLEKSNRAKLSGAGAVGSIMRAVKEHKNREKVVQAAIGALRTLSPQPEVREVIQELEGNKTVAHAMAVHLSVEAIQRDGIAFLSNAAVDIENQHVQVAPMEELNAIVRAMGAHPSSDLVVSGACFALKNYMFEEKNVVTLAKCGGVVSLLANAADFSHNDDCRKNANTVLRYLEMSPAQEQSLEQSLSDMHTSPRSSTTTFAPIADIEQVLCILNDSNAAQEETSIALQSLRVLAAQTETNRRRIVEARAFCIMRAMKSHQTSSKVQEHGCAVMEALASEGHEFRAEVISCGGCCAILAAIQQHGNDLSVLCTAFKALKHLSVEFECWFEVEKQGGVRKIEEVLTTYMDLGELQESGTEILTKFSAHDA